MNYCGRNPAEQLDMVNIHKYPGILYIPGGAGISSINSMKPWWLVTNKDARFYLDVLVYLNDVYKKSLCDLGSKRDINNVLGHCLCDWLGTSCWTSYNVGKSRYPRRQWQISLVHSPWQLTARSDRGWFGSNSPNYVRPPPPPPPPPPTTTTTTTTTCRRGTCKTRKRLESKVIKSISEKKKNKEKKTTRQHPRSRKQPTLVGRWLGQSDCSRP